MNKVSTLAVGTEVTDGQIVDRNAQWLSVQALELGYQVLEHRAVPDDREMILRALRDLASPAVESTSRFRNDVVFVTGGLGPTSDDFTRECIAEFAGLDLEWHEPSWTAIGERLRQRGSPVTENQKQQCYFPRGAVIFKNSGGTADAFSIVLANGVRVVSLPGPPREIENIWHESLRASLELQGRVDRRELTLLRTLGLGEGALANRVEEIIDAAIDACDSKARPPRPEVGYRASAPYVEIKLWATTAQKELVAEIAAKIRFEFEDILMNEGSADIADVVLARIAAESAAGVNVVMVDGLTQGGIFVRLFDRARELKDSSFNQALADSFAGIIMGQGLVAGSWQVGPQANPRTKTFHVESGASELEFYFVRDGRKTAIQLPKLAGTINSERGRKWVTEFVLREWGRA